jgi:hypothetical protein
MALLANLSQELCDDRSGNVFVITRVNHDGGSNTIEVPNGISTRTNQVAVIPEDDYYRRRTRTLSGYYTTCR